MGQLHMTNEAREWGLVDRFETMTAAVRRILDIEGLGERTGLHLAYRASLCLAWIIHEPGRREARSRVLAAAPAAFVLRTARAGE